MMRKLENKFIHEGDYVAKVEVELLYNSDDWSPYLSLEDAQKLDDVRLALRQKDLKKASQLACIYQLTPVS